MLRWGIYFWLIFWTNFWVQLGSKRGGGLLLKITLTPPSHLERQSWPESPSKLCGVCSVPSQHHLDKKSFENHWFGHYLDLTLGPHDDLGPFCDFNSSGMRHTILFFWFYLQIATSMRTRKSSLCAQSEHLSLQGCGLKGSLSGALLWSYFGTHNCPSKVGFLCMSDMLIHNQKHIEGVVLMFSVDPGCQSLIMSVLPAFIFFIILMFDSSM